MKHLISFIFLAFFAINSFAANKTALPDSIWARGIKSYDAKNSYQAFKKYIPHVGGSSEIAQVGHIIAEKKSVTVAQIKKELIKLYDLKGVAEGQTQNNYWLEGVSEKQGRFVRLNLQDNKDNYDYTVASIRLFQVWPTYYEVTALQNALSKTTTKTARSFFVEKLFGDSATAQLIPPSIFQNIMSEWTNSRNALIGFGADVRNGAVVLGDRLDSSASKIAGRVDKAASTFSNTLSPENFFKLGLAHGAGMALGGVLVNGAIELVPKALSELFRLMEGRLKTEDYNKLVKEAQDSWNVIPQLAQEISDLDKEMMNTLLAFEHVSKKDPLKIAQEIQDAENELARLNERSKHASSKDMCSADFHLSSMQVDIKDNMERLKEISKVLKVARDGEGMCRLFQSQLMKWTQIEGRMTIARNWILQGTNQFLHSLERKFAESAKTVASDRNEKFACEDSAYFQMAVEQNREYNCNCDTKRIPQQSCLRTCAVYSQASKEVEKCKSEIASEKTKESIQSPESLLAQMNTFGDLKDQLKTAREQVRDSFNPDGSFTKIKSLMASRFNSDEMRRLCPQLEIPRSLKAQGPAAESQAQAKVQKPDVSLNQNAQPGSVDLASTQAFKGITPQNRAAVLAGDVVPAPIGITTQNPDGSPIVAPVNQDTKQGGSSLWDKVVGFFKNAKPTAPNNFGEMYGN